MESLIETVQANVIDARVVRIELAIGKLTCISAEALRFAFDVAAAGTQVEGAALVIREIEGRGRCQRCGCTQPLAAPVPVCACGSFEIDVLEGEELQLQEVEVV